MLLQDVPRSCFALWFTGGKLFEVLVILFVYLGEGFLVCDSLRGSMSSFVFLNFILYLHHRLLDRSEVPFVLGTCTSGDISSGGHVKKRKQTNVVGTILP